MDNVIYTQRNLEQLSFHSQIWQASQSIPVFILRLFGGNSWRVFGGFLFNSKSNGGGGLGALTIVGTASHFSPAWLQGTMRKTDTISVIVTKY